MHIAAQNHTHHTRSRKYHTHHIYRHPHLRTQTRTQIVPLREYVTGCCRLTVTAEPSTHFHIAVGTMILTGVPSRLSGVRTMDP